MTVLHLAVQDWEEHQAGRGYKGRAGEKVDKEREALAQQARVKVEHDNIAGKDCSCSCCLTSQIDLCLRCYRWTCRARRGSSRNTTR